jgi:hypothetical protein
MQVFLGGRAQFLPPRLLVQATALQWLKDLAEDMRLRRTTSMKMRKRTNSRPNRAKRGRDEGGVAG